MDLGVGVTKAGIKFTLGRSAVGLCSIALLAVTLRADRVTALANGMQSFLTEFGVRSTTKLDV